ncbi:MAG: TetR family transcriptional regulator [Ancrocorticia sp.]|jgi:AcrR family transcriptional regulator|nr:TetR family transcriptional regulator [Ancrocorticia sp.]MCI1932809.1 TetR family transcriptional regulator [Ancrocorticia sp.]MCI1964351.1 TetR family transcriptional regulator [Ancrocorticia sp.]MCI2002921.1 TetR family transcriptional regulator [Ancrocorticia sp.]MCI2012665.1 TetR family transcriptional regulator [Ancrocorticia sp.]
MAHDEKSGKRGPQAKRGTVRARILEVARDEFIAKGYDGATIREIARVAQCDNALVSYYFGSKQLLFRECFNLPLDPAQEVLQELAPGPNGAGERLARHALWLYEEHLTADTMQALMRALITDAVTSQRFRTYMRNDVFGKIAEGTRHPDRISEEIELAMATMYGIVTMRYIVKLEPIASMPRERLIHDIAPLIQYRVDRIFALS